MIQRTSFLTYVIRLKMTQQYIPTNTVDMKTPVRPPDSGHCPLKSRSVNWLHFATRSNLHLPSFGHEPIVGFTTKSEMHGSVTPDL